MYLPESSSTKGFYFYDFHLSNRDPHVLNSQPQSSNYRSYPNSQNFYQREDFNNRLYDNVPRKPLVSQLKHSSSSQFNEIPIRPIAEVKPFYVYSTTDQAVASAEQRLYDAVSTLSRRRAAMTASETQFSPMDSSYRNSVKPQTIINSSANIIRPKPVYGYPNIHRSVSIGHDDASIHRDPYRSTPASHNDSYTCSKRSYYPVYRHCGVTMISPPSTCTLSRRSSAAVEHYGPKNYSTQETYCSPFVPPTRSKNSFYRTSFMDSPYELNQNEAKQYSATELGYVRNRPMNQSPYAVSNNAACMRNGFVERVNKSSLEDTHFDENSLHLRDDLTTVPTTNSKLRKGCRSCVTKGVDCASGQVIVDKEAIERKKSLKTSLNLEKASNLPHFDSCAPILERKQRAPPSYDALYSVSNISSSSSAYSSGSSPLDPSDLTTTAESAAEMLSIPLNCKVNYAPPRPHAKPFTIAAVSPNHVSTVSIPETSVLPPRATSALHFNSVHNKELGRTRRYSTLRPSKPPPPPPHQQLTSQQNKSAIPSPKLVSKRNKREERATILRAQSKISLMENFFQTGLNF